MNQQTRPPVWDLAGYIMEVTRCFQSAAPPDSPALIDVHFFQVAIDERLDHDRFNDLLEAAMDSPGEFNTINTARMATGPSYIELGAWIGDQGLALRTMAAGQAVGRWDVITPARLGITDEQLAADMAGRGLVMVSGLKDREPA